MSKRLTSADWIAFAMKALAARGFEALKADVLARELGVSRGSFYWHFPDLGDFHAAVVSEWRNVATEAIITDIEVHDNRERRLEALLQRAFGENSRIEVRMRAWAQSNPVAAKAVGQVDRRRLGYIEALLAELGVPKAAAAVRAKLLYWAYLGAAAGDRERLSHDQHKLLIAELMRLALASTRPSSTRRGSAT